MNLEDNKNEKNYWLFPNNNKYTKYVYSPEAAEEAYKTLYDCSNCIDCDNCIGCHNCVDCSICGDCIDCINIFDKSNLIGEEEEY